MITPAEITELDEDQILTRLGQDFDSAHQQEWRERIFRMKTEEFGKALKKFTELTKTDSTIEANPRFVHIE